MISQAEVIISDDGAKIKINVESCKLCFLSAYNLSLLENLREFGNKSIVVNGINILMDFESDHSSNYIGVGY